MTQDVKGFEVRSGAPWRKPKTIFKSDVLWRDEPSLSVKATFCLFTVVEKNCFRNNNKNFIYRNFWPRTQRAQLTLIDDSLQNLASPISSASLKESFQAPGAKFCALILEAAGGMAALPPVVIPGSSEWVVSIWLWCTHTLEFSQGSFKMKCVKRTNKLSVVYLGACEYNSSDISSSHNNLTDWVLFRVMVQDHKRQRFSKLSRDTEPVNVKLGFDLKSIWLQTWAFYHLAAWSLLSSDHLLWVGFGNWPSYNPPHHGRRVLLLLGKMIYGSQFLGPLGLPPRSGLASPWNPPFPSVPVPILSRTHASRVPQSLS